MKKALEEIERGIFSSVYFVYVFHLPYKVNNTPTILTPRKTLLPQPGCLGTLLPLAQIPYGQVGGSAQTSEPIFLASEGYQNFLAMVLRWRACLRKSMHAIYV